MKKEKYQSIYLITSIAVLIIVVYLQFYGLNIGLKGRDIDVVKYSSIVYNAIVAIGYCLIYKVKNNYILVGLIFTSFADFFLLLINNYFEVGMIFFIIAQLSYAVYLNKNKKIYLVRAIAVIVVWLILGLINQLSLLTLLVSFYFIQLALNMIEGFVNKKPLMGIGLLMFVCCDICVGLYNLGDVIYGAVFSYVQTAYELIWLFYGPSQILITDSYLRES